MTRIAAVAALFMLLALALATTVRVQSDFTAFLPATTTPEQRLLVAQLRDGLVSRTMLIALEGADSAALAKASRDIAARLSPMPEFTLVGNGASLASPGLVDKLLARRYVLSPGVTPESFTVEALRRALDARLEEFANPLGGATRALLPRDPTAEFAAVARQLVPVSQPALREGVWFDTRGERALLVAQTRAPGYDSAAQAVAVRHVQDAAGAANPAVRVVMSGPGVFAAESHRVIERDAKWLGAASLAAVLVLLAFVYRSPRAVLVVATPVALGISAGVLAVQAGFGSVHAITLGFGATLVGEAVDYPNYVLVQSSGDAGGLQRVGPTLALGVLTTVASALALAFSGFQGLAQLGVLTIVGILVAGIASRWLVPWLMAGHEPRVHALPIPRSWRRGVSPRTRVIGAIATVVAIAAAIIVLLGTHPAWWERDLANLSPVPADARARDTELRGEMGAPDVSFLAASRGATEDEALANAAAAIPVLTREQARGALRGFDSPAALVPPEAVQRARLAALPAPEALAANLREALRGTPFKPDAFGPFLKDVETARGAPLVTRADYAGTPLAAKLDALLVRVDDQWVALTPLAGVADATALESAIARETGGKTRIVDLKAISTGMVESYLGESLRQVAIGAVLIALLLLVGLRSAKRTARVLFPSLAAIALAVATMVALGTKISVFHLVALLLVLGIGLNYALFLENAGTTDEQRERTRQALALCVATSVATFGLLAFSSTPVLRAIGTTVAMGALLSLGLAVAWLGTPEERA
ncbi:MMPL family transporter [Usitatibacter palustris]|uniref:Membrane transport protein MMPL domain-containing protein n=1 Tax=Usitatibacter palustris TaxID=2732487 RepID=A0A6M4HB79_9PROT|nr:MMPL family transporter [Usitatibacter palustris]QJR15724.1 hypothetical protein DSM104440_02550 [Usitatibacter palustris]